MRATKKFDVVNRLQSSLGRDRLPFSLSSLVLLGVSSGSAVRIGHDDFCRLALSIPFRLTVREALRDRKISRGRGGFRTALEFSAIWKEGKNNSRDPLNWTVVLPVFVVYLKTSVSRGPERTRNVYLEEVNFCGEFMSIFLLLRQSWHCPVGHFERGLSQG